MNGRRVQPVIFVDDGYPEAREYANNYFPVAVPARTLPARNRWLTRVVRWVVRWVVLLRRRWRRRSTGRGRPVPVPPGVAALR